MSRYSGEGHVVALVEAGARWTSWTQDGHGRTVIETASKGQWGPARATTYAHTVDGQVAAITRGSDEPRVATFAHDGFQHVVSATDPRGVAWQQAFTPDRAVGASAPRTAK